MEKLLNDMTEDAFNVISLRVLYVKGRHLLPQHEARELHLAFSLIFLQLSVYFLRALHFSFKYSRKGTEKDLRFLEGQTGSTLLVESLMLVLI